MKLGILGAMKEEIKPLLERLTDIKETEYASNTFYEAKYVDLDVVVAYSKIGKVFSSMTATLMIEKFGCDKILFSGVAGGSNPELQIGDVVIGERLCQHDMDITAFGHEPGYVSECGVFAESDKDLVKLAKECADDLNMNSVVGTIATGDQFVEKIDKKVWIKDTFQADAIEMEGASVAAVCSTLGVPFVVIRSISDTAKEGASTDFQAFLEKAAQESANLIFRMIDKL